MSAQLDPDVQALAETIGRMRAAMIRCGVNGPFVLHVPANRDGLNLANKLKSQPPHPLNDAHQRVFEQYLDRELIGVLAGMELRFYDPKAKR